MEKYLHMIAERKLSISFSKYIVHVVCPVNKTSYIEYHLAPEKNAELVKVFESTHDALMSALENCHNNLLADDKLVITRNVNDL